MYALVIRVRKGSRVRLSSCLLATRGNRAGYREILRLAISDSKSEETRREFFGRLKTLGVGGVAPVVSDDNEGPVNAVQTHFQGASWQRRRIHFIKNPLTGSEEALAVMALTTRYRKRLSPSLPPLGA